MSWRSPSPASPTPGWQPRGIEKTAKPGSDIRTLEQRLAGGKLAVPEALRIAMSLADAVRKLHDQGRCHGALTPACVQFTGTEVELLPGRPSRGLVTAYMAPEVLRGQPADLRTDIFAFGAILYEMVTGRWPFEAHTPEEVANALLNAPAPGTGHAHLDGLLANCLAKDPETRIQRMQRVQMELRLLTVSERRTEGSLRRDNLGALVRAEVHQAVEARLAARLESQEQTVTELQQAVSASLQSVQAHLCTVDAKLATAQESASRAEAGVSERDLRLAGLEQRIQDPVERVARAELLAQATTERMSRAEQTVESVRRRVDAATEEAAVRLHALEQTVTSQNEALESARRALAQTEDLVERVVEALDSLQSIVLERADEKSSPVN